jgi:NAD-reducing hydrogenase large subunit
MSKKITIEPVTRIEGHAKITIHLDDDDKVRETRFHVVEFRGFEKFCEGRHFTEMPTLTERICGICPVSHHLASAKAGDAILGVQLPPTARKLRELMHMGQYIQSHGMSFFHLSAPDLLLGFDADPATRNVVGLIMANPDLGRRAIRLRQYGQEVIAKVAGRRVHPNAAVPGGLNKALTVQERDELRGGITEALETVQAGLALLKDFYAQHAEEVQKCGNFPSHYLGLVTAEGGLELYDGGLRFKDATGKILEDHRQPADYLSFIAEATEPWSYLKFPFYRPMGYPNGSYRVGPLGRLNVADHIDTPLASAEFQGFRSLNGGGPITGSLYYHYARLIEAVFSIERAQELLHDPDITGTDLIATPTAPLNPRGVGVVEAPRGTLYHDYQVDETGRLTNVNLIVSTGQNNRAMNEAVRTVAEHFVDGRNLREGMLNRVEAAIRCYDPCLSCSTHAVGQMPLVIELYGAEGEVVDRVRRA